MNRKWILIIAALFFLAYSLVCVVRWGLPAFGLVVGFVFFLTFISFVGTGRRRSTWTGYFYTDKGATTDELLPLFLIVFLVVTAPMLAIDLGKSFVEIVGIGLLLFGVGIIFVVYLYISKK